MKYLRLLICLLIIVSCARENKSNVINNAKASADSLVITKEDVDAIKFVEFVTDTKAESALIAWESYSEIVLALADFKNADFNFFENNEEVIETTLLELESTIPDKINTSPINARVLVLKTKFFKLKQQLELSNSTKEEKLKVLKEVFEANSNLTLQINKKYEKEAQKIIKPF